MLLWALVFVKECQRIGMTLYGNSIRVIFGKPDRIQCSQLVYRRVQGRTFRLCVQHDQRSQASGDSSIVQKRAVVEPASHGSKNLRSFHFSFNNKSPVKGHYQQIAQSSKMAALHPSNPYYNHAQNRDVQTQDTTDLLSGPPEDPVHFQPPAHPPRSASIATSTPSAYHPTAPSQQRKGSIGYTQQPVTTFRTRSIGGPFGGVYFERQIDLSPPNDDEIIIATVRVTDTFRRASMEENSELPARPPKRSFLRRVSTRVSSPTDSYRYMAMKMPRRDYKRYFMRDKDGGYAGSEPEKAWTEADLQREFGQYQDLPLRSIPGGQEFGEGVMKTSEGPNIVEDGEAANVIRGPVNVGRRSTGNSAKSAQSIPPDWRRG